MTTISHGKPYAGNPHVRFEEWNSASAEPRLNTLLRKFFVLISMFVLAGSSCGGWNLTTVEENELLAQTVHCQFWGRLRLTSECFTDVDEEFDRLVFMAFKDEKGNPVFPYRIRLERKEVVKEAFCYIDDELSLKAQRQFHLFERNLILGNCVTNFFEPTNPSMSALLAVRETNGVTYVKMRPPCDLLGKEVNIVDVSGTDSLESIPYFGDVVRQRWTDRDDELVLQRQMSELMRTTDSKKRICAWAVYSAGTIRDTRRKLDDAVKRKKGIKLRIWNEGVEMNRENALCIASIAIEHSDNGLLCRGLDVERGEKSLTVMCGVGVHGAGVRIRFDGCEMLIFP